MKRIKEAVNLDDYDDDLVGISFGLSAIAWGMTEIEAVGDKEIKSLINRLDSIVYQMDKDTRAKYSEFSTDDLVEKTGDLVFKALKPFSYS